MLLSSFLHGVEASHLADCRGSRVYLDFYLAITTNVPRFHLRMDGHVQFPNRATASDWVEARRIFDLGKHEALLDMLQQHHPESALYTCVSVDTQNGLRRGPRRRPLFHSKLTYPSIFSPSFSAIWLAQRAWTAWKLPVFCVVFLQELSAGATSSVEVLDWADFLLL